MTCPNCGRDVGAAANLSHHASRCLLAVLVATLMDRGHDVTGFDLEAIDADALWERFGGPAADSVAAQFGLPAYPPPRSKALQGSHRRRSWLPSRFRIGSLQLKSLERALGRRAGSKSDQRRSRLLF